MKNIYNDNKWGKLQSQRKLIFVVNFNYGFNQISQVKVNSSVIL